MKILLLINHYPPYHIGGEELSCQGIVEGLRPLGHHVEVLTSAFGASGSREGIHRLLALEMPYARYSNAARSVLLHGSTARRDAAITRQMIVDLQPDIVLVGSLWNIPRQVPALAEELLPGRVVYRLASYWPALPSQLVEYWQAPARSGLTRVPKEILRRAVLPALARRAQPDLRLEHAICISEAVFDECLRLGLRLGDTRIVHVGIDLEPFGDSGSEWDAEGIPTLLRLLYVGRLAPEKGIETAIEALGQLRGDGTDILTIAGSGDRAYAAALKQRAATLGLQERVRFVGQVEVRQVPDLMRRHHVLVVPSVWAEPFGRVVLEGMAAGLVVVGTATGGMAAALKDGVTGLAFQPGRQDMLAGQIELLRSERGLGPRLTRAARHLVREQFDEAAKVREIERYLSEVSAGAPPPPWRSSEPPTAGSRADTATRPKGWAGEAPA